MNTKTSATNGVYSRIMYRFNVDWSTLPYTELVKPLYSGLAARLKIDAYFRTTQIPGDVNDQATFWYHHYTINSWASGDPVSYFISKVDAIGSTCKAVVVFFLDETQ